MGTKALSCCPTCASGHMYMKPMSPVVWDTYRNIHILTPPNLLVPTCSHCGERELTRKARKAIDAQYYKCVALINRLNRDF